MSDLEMEAFEERLTADPSLVEEFEISLRLREGLEILRVRKELAPKSPPRRSRTVLAVRACLIMLALLALFAGLRFARPSLPIVARTVADLNAKAGAPLRVSARYTFATLRGANEPPTLSVPSSGALELRALTFSSRANETFRVALEEIRNHQPARIGEVKHLAPDADGFVLLYVDASQLEPADYVLNVQPDAESLPPERFEFRLAARPATDPKSSD